MQEQDSLFEPHPLIRGGQLQTLVAYMYPSAPRLERDQLLTVPVTGGDELILEINHPRPRVERAPIVYLLHGLGGSSASAYKLRIATKLIEQGFQAVRHNHRGCAPEGAKAQGIYHSGSVDDVLSGLRALAQTWPGRPIFIVGFSLSGTIMLNMLATRVSELAELPEVRAALSVCAPLDLHASSAALCRWTNRHYDIYYTKTLVKQLLALGMIDQSFAQSQFKKQSLRQFDEVFTAPRGGFADLDDYYTRCSPVRVMAQIRLPTLILSAADDPIVPVNAVLSAPFSPTTTSLLQPSGGHIGFISRQPPAFKDRRWIDAFVVKWAQKQTQLARIL